MNLVEIKIPFVGESVIEVEVQNWLVKVGDVVKVDASLVECECIKINFDLPSPSAGKIIEIIKQQGTAVIGEVIAHLDADVVPAVQVSPTPAPITDDSWKTTGRLPPQEWGIALQKATLERYRTTGQTLPLFYWKDGKITTE